MRKVVKQLLTETSVGKVLGRVPGVDAAYRSVVWQRQMNLFHGVFDSYDKALQACPAALSVGWDEAGIARNIVGDQVPGRSTRGAADEGNPGGLPILLHQPSTYAVMLWLSRAIGRVDGRNGMDRALRIVDVGGAGGITFWQYRQMFALPGDVTWTVVDMPHLIARGAELAAREGVETQLRFVSDIADAGPADVLIALGSLQYMSPQAFEDFVVAAGSAEQLIVNKMPLTTRQDYWTQQSLLTTTVPYWIANAENFIGRFEGMNLQIQDAWTVAELDIAIPFAPELALPRLSGFAMKRPQNDASPADVRHGAYDPPGS